MSDWVVSIALWYSQRPLRKLLEKPLRRFNLQTEQPGRARAEGEEMSDAERSAYLLIAGGLIWLLVGIVGLVRLARRRVENGRDRAKGEDQMTDNHSAERLTTNDGRSSDQS
jgi:hypothetical protein